MKTMNLFWGMALLGAFILAGAVEQAGAQPGMGGGGRGWGAQMRRAQLAQQAEQTSSSAKTSSPMATPAGCPGCGMGGGCCMMGSSAATTQSLQQNFKADQTTSATQAMSMGRGRGMGMGMGRGMMGMGGPREDMREAMPVIHALLAQHAKIRRKVENIPQGIVTETISVDLEVAAQIRKHVGQMKTRLEQRQPMRMWDPLFQEIFRNAEKIQMKIEEIPGGVRVTETSADPQTQRLIRQHAQAVVKFVEKGMPAAMEAHALPAGYASANNK